MPSALLSPLQESFHLWIVEEGKKGGHRSEYGEWIFLRNYIIGRIRIKEVEKGGTKMKAMRIIEKMQNVTKEKPATSFSHHIAKDRTKFIPSGHFKDKVWEVDARDNGQMKRTPEAGIYLHQFWDPIPWIYFELGHRHASPIQRLEEREAQLHDLRMFNPFSQGAGTPLDRVHS
jgi:hypothetical protein